MFRYILCVSFIISGAAYGKTKIDISRGVCSELLSTTRAALIEKIFENQRPSELAASIYGRAAGKKLLERLAKISAKYDVLISEIGLVSKIDEFETFMKTQKKLTAKEARAQFSDYLGFEEVYRGLALRESDLKDILDRGLLPNPIRGHALDPKDSSLLELLSYSDIDSQLRAHVTQQTDQSLFMSVTKIPAIGVAVASLAAENANRMLGQWPSQFRSIYLFKLRIPKIDLVYLGKTLGSEAMEQMDDYKVVVHKRSGATTYGADAGIEAFAFLKIGFDEIVGIERVKRSEFPVVTSVWQGKSMSY